MRDKLLFYILALALHIEGFEMDLEVLASELKLSPRECAQRACPAGPARGGAPHPHAAPRRFPRRLGEQVRHLGCSVATKAEKSEDGKMGTAYIAKLDVPLSFPRPRRKRARR